MFAFAKFNVGEAPVNIKLGQTTVYWGEGLSARRRRARHFLLAEPDRRVEGSRDAGRRGEGTVPAAGRLQRPVAGDRHGFARRAVLLQLAELQQPGVPIPGVRHLPERRRSAAVGRRVVHPWTESLRGGAGLPGLPSCLARQGHRARRELGQLRCRAALEPDVGRRDLRGVLPSHLRHAAPVDAHARTGYDGAGANLRCDRRPAPWRHQLHHQPAGDQPVAAAQHRARPASTTPPLARTSTCSA